MDNPDGRDKLRSIAEACADPRVLKELLELIPGATLGGVVKIKCRPRVTQHGGGTKTAVVNDG